MIKVVYEDGLHCPKVICDVCKHPICAKTGRLGMNQTPFSGQDTGTVLYNMDTGEIMAHVHKQCDDLKHTGTQELTTHLDYIAYNFKH